jgi:hypothetical protein
MRGFLFGLILILILVVSVLSIRPGGLRRQLRFAARRFRIALVLGGVYVAGSAVVKIAFPQGPAGEYGLPILAVVLGVVFAVLAQDPATPAEP